MKNLNEEQLKTIVARNLATYRKISGLTQLEIAERLNYSDKAISKWESGGSLPDLYTLTQLAAIYGIGVNDFLKERKIIQGFIANRKRNILALFTTGIVYFVACIIFIVFVFLIPIERPWLPFVFGVPVTSIALIVLYSVWKKPLLQFIFISLLVWGLAVSLDVTLPQTASWTYYIVAIPVQIIIISVFWFSRERKG